MNLVVVKMTVCNKSLVFINAVQKSIKNDSVYECFTVLENIVPNHGVLLHDKLDPRAAHSSDIKLWSIWK